MTTVNGGHRQLVSITAGTGSATPAEVGGKGYSLLQMAEADLPVPPGFVLTTRFFTPWLEVVRASSPWAAVNAADSAEWPTMCGELVHLCSTLELRAKQQETVLELRRRPATFGEDALFAVRSSSPEEDLASASFAGGYETRLGVRVRELEGALRHCFASAFDARVLLY